jgi:hypothetical protein
VQESYLHWPVKSVIPVKVLEFKVIVSFVINTLRAFVARYLSFSEKGVNGEKLKVPVMDVLGSP